MLFRSRLDYQISFFSKYGAISGDRGFMPHSGHISDRRARSSEMRTGTRHLVADTGAMAQYCKAPTRAAKSARATCSGPNLRVTCLNPHRVVLRVSSAHPQAQPHMASHLGCEPAMLARPMREHSSRSASTTLRPFTAFTTLPYIRWHDDTIHGYDASLMCSIVQHVHETRLQSAARHLSLQSSQLMRHLGASRVLLPDIDDPASREHRARGNRQLLARKLELAMHRIPRRPSWHRVGRRSWRGGGGGRQCRWRGGA